MKYGDYGDYLKRRWDELGGEEATDAVRRRLGVFREQDMGWGNEATQQIAEQRAEEFKKAQMPIFVQIAGELHHRLGHRDVGLGKKTGGNRWETPNGPIASDILVLKDLDGGPDDQLVDCFSSMGGPETKPAWNVIEPNSDRTFVVPPVPADGPVDDPVDPTDSDDVLARLTAAEASLKEQRSAVAVLASKVQALQDSGAGLDEHQVRALIENGLRDLVVRGQTAKGLYGSHFHDVDLRVTKK